MAQWQLFILELQPAEVSPVLYTKSVNTPAAEVFIIYRSTNLSRLNKLIEFDKLMEFNPHF